MCSGCVCSLFSSHVCLTAAQCLGRLGFGGLSSLIELTHWPLVWSWGEYTVMRPSIFLWCTLAFPGVAGAVPYFGTWHQALAAIVPLLCRVLFSSPASFVLKAAHEHSSARQTEAGCCYLPPATLCPPYSQGTHPLLTLSMPSCGLTLMESQGPCFSCLVSVILSEICVALVWS